MRPSPLRLLDHREFPILYVDDEPDNLRIFELTFRKDFSILTASDAAEGLELLNANPVSVVLSDQRMPGMTGVEFLSRVRELDSNTIRILITAFGDAETLGVAINDGSIYRYVAKPWEPEDLRQTLQKAIEAYALDRERDALIRELTQLNALSKELHRELEVDRLISVLLNSAQRDLGFDGASLFFFQEAGDRLSCAGLAPEDEVLAESLQGLELDSQSAPEFIQGLRSGVPQKLSIDDIDQQPRVLRDWLSEVSADEILVMPLVGKEEVVGALAIDNRRGGKRFGADDQMLLDGIATQTVIALENARIVEALRAARNQVQRADRLGTLGTMAAGLAHEINNPLVSVQTFLTLAPEKRGIDDDEFWKNYHALACSELERIRGLVGTMSQLAHGGVEEGRPSEVDLVEMAEEVATLSQGEVAEAGVNLRVEYSSRPPAVWGIRPHLQQVLLNLLHNAIQATPEEGEIAIRIESGSNSQEEIVNLTVEDSGEGIADENVERIFDPFFTTKDPDQGTGLGLMITHRIVSDHGGAISVRSRPGEGASFRVSLPVKPNDSV